MYRLQMMSRRDFANAAALRARHSHLALVSIDTTHFLKVKTALEDAARQLTSDLCTLRVAEDVLQRYGPDQRLAVLIDPDGEMLVWRQWPASETLDDPAVTEMYERQLAGKIIDHEPLSSYGVRCALCGPQGLKQDERGDGVKGRCPVCLRTAPVDNERRVWSAQRALKAELKR